MSVCVSECIHFMHLPMNWIREAAQIALVRFIRILRLFLAYFN